MTPIEKKWVAFQLLIALTETHAKSIYHGDIKCENVLLTSWNWCYLSDFSSFKPVYLPDVNDIYFRTTQPIFQSFSMHHLGVHVTWLQKDSYHLLTDYFKAILRFLPKWIFFLWG
jgi:serine/threonine protein kinase